MKRISLEIFLPFMIIFLLVGCVKSSSVSVEQKPNVTPQIVEQPMVTPQIIERPMVIPRKPDSNLWEHLGKTYSGDCYYSKTNIKTSSIILVRTYKIVSEDFRKETIEKVKTYDLKKSIKYYKYEHNIRVDEIDCQKKLYRLKESIDYDDNGNVLDNFTYTNSQWKSIPVLTGLDSLRGKLCVDQKKPLKKKK